MGALWGPPCESIEHEDGAGHLAGLHRPERLVDVLEPAAARDHLVELEPPLAVELDVARHVDLEPVAAHAAALHLLLAKESRTVELDLLPDRDHTDDGGRSSWPEAVECLLRGFFEPDGFECIVHARPRELPDGLDRIGLRRVH